MRSQGLGHVARWAAALLLVLAACGGGGGGGGSSPTPPQASLTFTPSGTPPANSISLRRNGAGTTTLVLEVQATGVTDLYGVAFDLQFPANLLRYQPPATTGGFLGGDGQGTSLLVEENPAGNLVVGFTRLGAVGGVSGSGTLMTLTFTAIGSGSGSIQFAGNRAYDDRGRDLGGVSWVGGTVQVQL